MNGKEVRVGACLLVYDIDKMARFYRDILGFATDWAGENIAEFKTANGRNSLFMYNRERFMKALGQEYVPPKGINQAFEIVLWLPSFDDVDTEYERLSKLEVQFPCGAPVSASFGMRSFYVADPEGNLVEIASMNEK